MFWEVPASFGFRCNPGVRRPMRPLLMFTSTSLASKSDTLPESRACGFFFLLQFPAYQSRQPRS